MSAALRAESAREVEAMGYERKNIAAMHGYVPGKQPVSRDTIKLNTNENPYPPCAEVAAALRAFDVESLRRYPQPSADGVRAAIAAAHGLAKEQIVVVNGGDELLRLAFTTFVEPGEPVGVCSPSYSLYPVLAEVHGSPLVQAELTPEFALPARLAATMNEAGARLLLLVNPHAPSGALTQASALRELAANFRGVLLVDEAYVDFVDPERGHDMVAALAEHDNVLLLRTLSKGYSLAGLRVGYGLGAASLIEPLLWKTRDSYNVDAVAQALATVAIEQRAHAAETWRKVRQERARVGRELRALGFEVPDSQSNFVLARVPRGHDAAALQRTLEARGVLVRYFAEPRLLDRLRITIGTPEQDDRLLALLRELTAPAS